MFYEEKKFWVIDLMCGLVYECFGGIVSERF